jgi:hypothetical protein
VANNAVIASYRPTKGWWSIFFPELRIEAIPVARFKCKKKGRTFSLLPHQLAPYHRYTIASMLFAVALFCQTKDAHTPLEDGVLGKLPCDCLATLGLVRSWVTTVRRALCRAHFLLMHKHDLGGIGVGSGLGDHHVVSGYLKALQLRATGPPSPTSSRFADHVNTLLIAFCSKKRPFMGTPSQGRRGGLCGASL